MGTAKGLAACLDPVADDADAAMHAPWRHAFDCTFETVECHDSLPLSDNDRLVIVVSAYIAHGHWSSPLKLGPAPSILLKSSNRRPRLSVFRPWRTSSTGGMISCFTKARQRPAARPVNLARTANCLQLSNSRRSLYLACFQLYVWDGDEIIMENLARHRLSPFAKFQTIDLSRQTRKYVLNGYTTHNGDVPKTREVAT
jgi:hypothetical protein